jgi:hypothetical protein
MIASEPLPHFVDDLLDYLHETHPTHATLDGVHTHDDLLEDVSRNGIESEAYALSGYLRRLDEIHLEALTRVRATRAPDTAHLQGRMFQLEAVRTWEHPQFYSDLGVEPPPRRCSHARRRPNAPAARAVNASDAAPDQAARDSIKDRPASTSRSASRRCVAR